MLAFFSKILLAPILDTLFPKYCVACESNISSQQNFLCFTCLHQLPYTEMERGESAEAHIRLLTKLPLVKAAALCYFVEEGILRNVMHALKYQNQPDLGIFLGEMLAERFALYNWFDGIDAIMPVPLHWSKQQLRGYNQSEMIAQGISAVTNIPVCNDILIRNRKTASQTTMSRVERESNVKDAFELRDPGELEGQHILLVDDVLTTGATIAACGKALRGAKCNISVATLAIAQ